MAQLNEELASGQFDLTCLLAATATVVFKHESDLVAFVERADARALKCCSVNEHVVAAIFRLNEAEALGCVEEFYNSSGPHRVTFFPFKSVQKASHRASRMALRSQISGKYRPVRVAQLILKS